MGGGGPPYSVFFGNVPYDATEERLRDMFSEVGPVHDLRCVFPSFIEAVSDGASRAARAFSST